MMLPALSRLIEFANEGAPLVMGWIRRMAGWVGTRRPAHPESPAGQTLVNWSSVGSPSAQCTVTVVVHTSCPPCGRLAVALTPLV